jgi:hypothetical protein
MTDEFSESLSIEKERHSDSLERLNNLRTLEMLEHEANMEELYVESGLLDMKVRMGEVCMEQKSIKNNLRGLSSVFNTIINCNINSIDDWVEVNDYLYINGDGLYDKRNRGVPYSVRVVESIEDIIEGFEGVPDYKVQKDSLMEFLSYLSDKKSEIKDIESVSFVREVDDNHYSNLWYLAGSCSIMLLEGQIGDYKSDSINLVPVNWMELDEESIEKANEYEEEIYDVVDSAEKEIEENKERLSNIEDDLKNFLAREVTNDI